MKRNQIVFAHDERKAVLWVFFFNVNKSVTGIVRSWKVKLYGGYFEFWIVFNGAIHQCISVMIGQHTLFLFEGTLGGDDQPNFIQIGGFGHVIGQDDVANMNGVKTSKKQTYFRHGAKVMICLGCNMLSHQFLDLFFCRI